MQTPEYNIFLVDRSNHADYANQTFQWLYDDFALSQRFVEEHEESYYDSDENFTEEEKLLFEMHQENASYNATHNEKIIRGYFKKEKALVAYTKQKGECVGYLVWDVSEKGYGIKIVSVGVQIDHRRKGLMSLMIQTLCEQYPQSMVLALTSTPPAKKVYENAGWTLIKDNRTEKLNECTKVYFRVYKLDYCFDIHQTILEENPAYQSIPIIENELFRQRLIERDTAWTDRWEKMVQSTLSEFQFREDSNSNTTSYYKPTVPLSALLSEPPKGLSIQICQEYEHEVVKNPEAYQPQMKYYPLTLDEEGNLAEPFFFHLEAYRKNYLAICYDGKILEHKEKKSFSNLEGYLHGSFEHLIGIHSGAADFRYQSTNTGGYSGESFIMVLDKLPERLFRLMLPSIHEKQSSTPLSSNPSSFVANLHQETSDQKSTKKRKREDDEVSNPGDNKKARLLEQSENKSSHSESDDEFNLPFT